MDDLISRSMATTSTTIQERRCRVNLAENRHIMAQMYKDGKITEAEYKTYLREQEERERETSERFEETVKRMVSV